MLTAAVFVLSFVYDDQTHAKTVQTWHHEGRLADCTLGWDPPQIHPRDKTKTAPTRVQLKGAQKVVVLVGKNTHSFKAINDELAYAVAKKKTIVPVLLAPGNRLPDAIKTLTPITLEHAKLKTALKCPTIP